MLARLDFLYSSFSHFISAHFRLFVVCLDLWRRNKHTLFAVECLFFAAVEEECHMGILFCFSNAKLLEAALGNVFAENICKLCWLECDVYILEAFVILCEADVVWLDYAFAFKTAFVFCESRCDFTRSVRTEVEENNSIVRVKTCVSRIYHWLEEFVCYAFFIALFDGCNKVFCLVAFHLCDSIISKLKTFPALVSVHSIESAHNSSDGAAALFCHIILKFAYKALCGSWGNVTSVCEAMHKWGNVILLAEVDESEKMCEVRVDTAVRKQTPEMELAACLLYVADSVKEFFVIEESAILDVLCDSGKFLINNAACTHICVAYFAVAHLSVRKTYVKTGALEAGVWKLCHELVHEWCICICDGIAGAAFAHTVAIENY